MARRKKRTDTEMGYMTEDYSSGVIRGPEEEPTFDYGEPTQQAPEDEKAQPSEMLPVDKNSVAFVIEEVEKDVSKAYSMSRNAPVNRILKRAIDNLRSIK